MNLRRSKTFDNFQEYAQLLLASRIFSEYLDTQAVIVAARHLESKHNRKFSDFPIEDIEPEYFAERWIQEHEVRGCDEWKDAVFSYFIKLLVNYSNPMNGK